jgi:hypothetical protein
MASNLTPENVSAPENDHIEGVKTPEKTVFFIKPKEILVGEALPGSTIARPLRKRGAKGSATPMNDNVANGNRTTGKCGDDLKVMETNSSEPGVGELEALHEVRSNEELLEGEEGGSAGRVPRRDHGDRSMQGNSGAGIESNLSGGGEFKTYKRKYFGLFQLILLNIIVSWDVSCHDIFPLVQYYLSLD